MSPTNTSYLQTAAIALIPLVFAITLHEAAHAWVAKKNGDNTAHSLGRVSLNPFVHIDPIGTLLVPLIMLKLGGFLFGWAKPVPVNWRNLNHPRRDKALVAIAGPAANGLMALGWTGIIALTLLFKPSLSTALLIKKFVLLTALFGVQINIILGILNLLPLPPLDGSRIIASALPPHLAQLYEKIEPFGLIILLALLVTGALAWLIGPMIHYSIAMLLGLIHTGAHGP